MATITQQYFDAAVAFLNVNEHPSYNLDYDGDMMGLYGAYTKEQLAAIIVCKQWDTDQRINKGTYVKFGQRRTANTKSTYHINTDSSLLTLNGLITVRELTVLMCQFWPDMNPIKFIKELAKKVIEKPITKEQYATADAYLDDHNQEAWIDVPGTGKEVKLDGWFTVEDLEAVITMKKYLLQNPEAKTDA
jgi:hypothetical protein